MLLCKLFFADSQLRYCAQHSAAMHTLIRFWCLLAKSPNAASGISKSATDAYNLTLGGFLETSKATTSSTHLKCFLLFRAEAAWSLSSLVCATQLPASPSAPSIHGCGNATKAHQALSALYAFPTARGADYCVNAIKAQMWLLPLQPPLPYVYQSLFKHKVKIVDEYGAAWPVQYEGFVSAAQRHYRFTAGWTNLVKQKGIKVGKTLIASHTLT